MYPTTTVVKYQEKILLLKCTKNGELTQFMLAPYIVVLIYGEKFTGSIAVVEIICLLPLLSAMSGLMGVQTMLNLEMDSKFLRITTIGAVISIILNFILNYRFGYIGTAVSYLSTEVFIVVSLFLTL
ncbi:hypothetical protein OBK08_01970 [Empedobacter falsenii]